jgi:hypothetical protein
MLMAFLLLVWFLCIVLAPAMERAAAGKPGGVSIFPGFPVIPLMAWGIAWLLDLLTGNWGTYLIVALHVVLLAAVIPAIFRFRRIIRIRKANQHLAQKPHDSNRQ